MRNTKLAIIIFALVGFSLLLGACYAQTKTSEVSEGVAGDFALTGITGEKITLSKILKDKNVVLVFWATWCPYCVKEVPDVQKFYNENKDKVAVIGINLQESKAKVGAFVKTKGITYPVALDSDGIVGRSYNVRGIPTVVAIDKKGKIIYHGHSIEEMAEKTGFLQ